MSESDEPELWVETAPVDGCVTLRLNRPQRKNALTRSLVLALGAELKKWSSDPSTRVIVLRGSGGAFCSGADLTSIVGAQADEVPQRIAEFHQLITSIVHAHQPVIAVVDGPAVGFGADLALACDMRIFSPQGYLEEGFVKVGLMPDGGGTYFLPRFCGPRAFEYLTLGTRLNSVRCAELGVANEVREAEQLEAHLQTWCRSFTAAAPLALRRIKEAVRAPDRSALAKALSLEKEGQTKLVLSEDFQEGVQAFLQKRPPVFRGR